MSLLDEAISFAALAHAGQLRKYTGEPYIVHPIEVMSIVHRHGGTEEMKIAAVLHDVVEDCSFSLDTIRRFFGNVVEELVDGLTDQFTKENYPELNRDERKARERERLAGSLPMVQTIKYADLISNTASIVAHDKNFARKYLLLVMNEGDEELLALALRSVTEGQTQLMRDTLQ
jgi:guanosine-3',5'-bis(diphosphate) 3'-pyrophosphohydrolase